MSDIKMRGPTGASSTLSHDGNTFKADKKGVFTVPFEAYEILSRHGFTAIGQPKTDEEIAEEENQRLADEEAARVEDELKASEASRLADEEAAIAAARAMQS